MFAARYFTPRYFAPRFFTARITGGGSTAIPVSQGKTIVVSVGDGFTLSGQVLEASTRVGIDLRNRELQFVVENARGGDVAVVDSITVDTETPSKYSLAIPSEATARVAHYTYSLRDLTNRIVLQRGAWLVRGVAIKD